jgi:hypothetical protein
MARSPVKSPVLWRILVNLVLRRIYPTKRLRPRADYSKNKCADTRPKVVISYGLELADGTSLLPHWSRIASGWLEQAIAEEKILLWRRNLHALFFATWHHLPF